MVLRRESRSTPPGSSSRTSPRVRGRKCSPTQASRHIVVVTGATARTVFTRERPEVSELQLEMGVRVPLLADWPADRSGQWTTSLHGACDRAAVARRTRCAAVHPSARCRRPPMWRATTCRSHRAQPAAAELQVPGRALRLGTRLQRARLQRLRFRGVSQLRRHDAAQYPRSGREPGAAAHHVRRRRSVRASDLQSLRNVTRSAISSTSPATS